MEIDLKTKLITHEDIQFNIKVTDRDSDTDRCSSHQNSIHGENFPVRTSSAKAATAAERMMDRDDTALALSALSSHLAHIQLRLKQVVAAPRDRKNDLLMELEQYAFNGVNIDGQLKRMQHGEGNLIGEMHEVDVSEPDVISGIPDNSNILSLTASVKRRIDWLKSKGHQSHSSNEHSWRDNVGRSVVNRIHGDVSNIEAFIEHLENSARVHRSSGISTIASSDMQLRNNNYEMITRFVSRMRSVLLIVTETILQTMTCGCQPIFLKRFGTIPMRDCSDVMSDLGKAVEAVLDQWNVKKVQQEADKAGIHKDFQSNAVTIVVRQQLAAALQVVFQHGLARQVRSVVPSAVCFDLSWLSHNFKDKMDAWTILTSVYHERHGEEYNRRSCVKIRASFQISECCEKCQSIEGAFLFTVGKVMQAYSSLSYPVSASMHFKAFVCHALNEGRLDDIIRYLDDHRDVFIHQFAVNSLIRRIGLSKVATGLAPLKNVRFDLPLDCVTNQFNNIADLFA